jgi:uncharacterized protein (UPF0332 family)
LDRIEYHLEEAQEKLDFAKFLLEGGYFKDAVSRAYYCMYNAARAMLLTKDISPKTHKGLIIKFGEEFNKMEENARHYATILHKAEDLREMAESAVDDAEIFLKKIREVLKR